MNKVQEQNMFEKIAENLELIKNQVLTQVRKTYSTEEAAEFIGVSKKTLYTYRKQGKIGYYQMGLVVRLTNEDVQNFIIKNKHHAKS